MPSRWKHPRVGEAWATCQWCGQDYPASKVWLNPRFGFQCFKCWDGLIQRDQIRQPIFPYEGTRKTIDPLTNTLFEGTGATTEAGLNPTYTYVFVDRVTGLWYSVNFNASTLDPTIVTTYPDTQMSALDYIEVNNEYRIYVANGELQAQTTRPSSCPHPTPSWLKVCDLGTAGIRVTPGGEIIYTPPDGEPVVVNPPFPPVTCVVATELIREYWEAAVCVADIPLAREYWDAAFCDVPDVLKREYWES